MPIGNEIVDAGIDDEATEVQRPNAVVVRRGPTKLELNTVLHLDMPSIELRMMRAWEHVESLEDVRNGRSGRRGPACCAGLRSFEIC